MSTSMNDVELDMAMSALQDIIETTDTEEEMRLDMKLAGFPDCVIEQEIVNRFYLANKKNWAKDNEEEPLPPGSLF